MNSEEYWNDAALRREIAVQTRTNYTGEEILKLYDEALSDIDTEIQKIKINFQKRFGVDNDTATYFLTQAQQEQNLNSLIKSLEYAPNEQARKDILHYIKTDGLSVRAYAARKERYEAVKAVIYAKIKEVAVKSIDKLSDRLQNVYKESYYGVMDDTAKQLNVGINFAILNQNAINAAVNSKWHGKQFSQNIWDNTDRLATTAQNLVIKSFMSGEAWNKTADKLATTFQAEKYNATRLVHTEASHIHAMADLQAYEDIGAEEYRYLATLDYRTCERCQQWDNMVLPLSEAREGYNYPVLHPLCRCTTTIAVDLKNRRARDPLTGKNEIVDGSVTYQEWYNSLSDEQKAAIKTAKEKDSKRTSKKLQQAKKQNTASDKSAFGKNERKEYNNLLQQKNKFDSTIESLTAKKKAFELEGILNPDKTETVWQQAREVAKEIETLQANNKIVAEKMTHLQGLRASDVENTLKKLGVAENVKLSNKMSIDGLDTVERTMKKLIHDEGMPPLKGVVYNPKYQAFMDSSTVASYSMLDQTMYLSRHFNDIQTVIERRKTSEKAFTEWQKSNKKTAQQALENAKKELENAKSNGQKSMIKANINQNKANIAMNRKAVSETVEDILTHEYGHHLHNVVSGSEAMIYQRGDIYGKKELNAVKYGHEWVWSSTKKGQVIAAEISQYATTTPLEAIAEAYTAYKKGEKIPPEYEKLILEMIKKAKRL